MYPSHTSYKMADTVTQKTKIIKMHMTLPSPTGEKKEANLNRKKGKTARQIQMQIPRVFKG